MQVNHFMLFLGVGSSISSSSGLCPSTPVRPQDLRHSRVTRIMSKLQILSPISDKSQEQTSSPSSSPQEAEAEQRLTSEVWPADEWHASRAKKRNLNLNLSSTMAETGEQSLSFKSLRTPDIQQLLNVPWDVPKLKKKLQNRNFCFRGQPSSPELSPKRFFEQKYKDYLMKSSFAFRLVHPKSPDVEALLSSGLEVKAGEKPEGGKSLSLQFEDFSEVTPCTVVKTPELEAYLEVPWEVPKLRKKLQSRKKIPPQEFMQGSDSGISMSSQETREVAPWLQAPKLRRRLELEGGGCSQAPPARVERQQRAGSGSEGESRRSLCLSQPSNSSVAANAEFLVQSYPGPRPASMVSASLGLACRSAAEGGGEGAAEAVKLGEEREVKERELGNGESFQPPPDISDLPFSMPKLARRLGQAPSSPPLKLFRQPATSQSLSLNVAPPDSGVCSSQPCSPTFPGAKPLRSRPMSLIQPSQAGPQLNLPPHSRPGENHLPIKNIY